MGAGARLSVDEALDIAAANATQGAKVTELAVKHVRRELLTLRDQVAAQGAAIETARLALATVIKAVDMDGDAHDLVRERITAALVAISKVAP